MLWALWIALVFSYYGIFTWLPSLLLAKGFTLREALWLNLAIAVFQIPGYYAAAALVDRIGRKVTLVAFLACAALGSFFFAGTILAAQPAVGAVLAWGAVIAFFNLGAWGVTYTYTPEQYPTAIRASGVGFAAGAGRLVGAFSAVDRRLAAGPLRLALRGVRDLRRGDAGRRAGGAGAGRGDARQDARGDQRDAPRRMTTETEGADRISVTARTAS